MWDQHSSLGVAQAVFYVPAVLVTMFLVFRHDRPRMAWLTLLLFSIVRFVGGIIVVLYKSQPTNDGLLVAAIVLTGVGVFPLMLSTIGLIRIIVATDFRKDQWLNRLVFLARTVFLLGVVLIIIGGCLEGQVRNPGLSHTGSSFSKASYIVAICTVLCIVLFRILFLIKAKQLSHSSNKILMVIPGAIVCLSIRIAYACLSVFIQDPVWDPLGGSIGVFVGMALLQEYIIVMLFAWIGFSIPKVGNVVEDYKMSV